MGIRNAWLLVAACLLAACGGGGLAPVATAQKGDVALFEGHGIYWNPAEPGSGFFFERQGAMGAITFFVYEEDGRATWYTAAGTFTDAGGDRNQFSGTLLKFTGGLSMTDTSLRQPTGAAVSPVTVVFQGDQARVQLPGRSYTAERVHKEGQRLVATSKQPETGIYWNPKQPGRGFIIEVNGNVATVGAFLYADDGQPTWLLATIQLPPGTAVESAGDLLQFAGGQTLTGSYKPANLAKVLGQLGLDFGAACTGRLTFPGMPVMQVQRFRFGDIPEGAECRRDAASYGPGELPGGGGGPVPLPL